MTDDLTMHASMEVFTGQLYKLIEQMDKQPKERKNLISQMCQIRYIIDTARTTYDAPGARKTS